MERKIKPGDWISFRAYYPEVIFEVQKDCTRKVVKTGNNNSSKYSLGNIYKETVWTAWKIVDAWDIKKAIRIIEHGE